MKFVFDLDGTLTRRETVPLIARHFCIDAEIDALTRDTVEGVIPFAESLRQRVAILGAFSVSETRDLLKEAELFEDVVTFIGAYSEDCIVATGNLDVWISGLCDRIGCQSLTSHAQVADDRVTIITHILRKEDIVKELQARGETVVFVGDGHNDVEAMRAADCAIASGLVHWPARAVLEVCDFAVFEDAALTRLLGHLKVPDAGDNDGSILSGEVAPGTIQKHWSEIKLSMDTQCVNDFDRSLLRDCVRRYGRDAIYAVEHR